MTKYPPNRTAGLRQMKALAEGEGSETFRVRAQRPLLDWFKAMSAEERGAVLARLMVWADRDVPAVSPTNAAAVTPAAAPAAVQSTAAISEAPSRPSGEALRWSGTEPPRLSKTQAEVLGYLRSGAVLVRKGIGGQWWAWWPDGSEQKLSTPTTVEVLRKAGAVRPA